MVVSLIKSLNGRIIGRLLVWRFLFYRSVFQLCWWLHFYILSWISSLKRVWTLVGEMGKQRLKWRVLISMVRICKVVIMMWIAEAIIPRYFVKISDRVSLFERSSIWRCTRTWWSVVLRQATLYLVWLVMKSLVIPCFHFTSAKRVAMWRTWTLNSTSRRWYCRRRWVV